MSSELSVRSQSVATFDSDAPLLAPTRPSGLQRGLIQQNETSRKLPRRRSTEETQASCARDTLSLLTAINKECSVVHRHSALPRLLSERQRRRRSVPRQRRLRRLVPHRRPEVSSRAQQPRRLAAQQHLRPSAPHLRRQPAAYLANQRPQRARHHSAVHPLVPPEKRPPLAPQQHLQRRRSALQPRARVSHAATLKP